MNVKEMNKEIVKMNYENLKRKEDNRRFKFSDLMIIIMLLYYMWFGF